MSPPKTKPPTKMLALPGLLQSPSAPAAAVVWVQEEARPSVSFKEHFFVVEKIKRTKNRRERQRNFTGTTTGIGGAKHGGY